MPSASLVPCVRSLPEGWTLGAANARNGWTRFTLDHDRVGRPALVVRLTADLRHHRRDRRHPPTSPGTRRYERTEPGQRRAVDLLHRVPGRLRHRPAPLDEQRRRHRSSTRRHPPSASPPATPSNKHSTNARTGDSTSTRATRNDHRRPSVAGPEGDLVPTSPSPSLRSVAPPPSCWRPLLLVMLIGSSRSRRLGGACRETGRSGSKLSIAEIDEIRRMAEPLVDDIRVSTIAALLK